MSKGIFITLEGGEGSGKTTMIGRLSNYLEERNIAYLVTREPGGIEIAEKIRSIILDPEHTAMDARTEALLYAAARRQHLVEKVIPALEEGLIVLCDRFVDSSLVYQGYARGIGEEEIRSINLFATEGITPNVTIYFDVDPEIGFARIAANQEREVNRLDLENRLFHDKVRAGYLKLVENEPERIKMIDASLSPDEVFCSLIANLDCVLKDI
ncbi:thymidylate kinase [Paenibacillus sp. J45TS6]|uniref:dTMP kinase n=1 Tax=unclassified Paenibacillus TaxID=185978 RepID=UPI001B0A6C69|nr:dTMP kinase [Paenibacillus sp. J45TS6]GIP45799.1 thymidylate kinase [Paenibacillus sp. J45TS6]